MPDKSPRFIRRPPDERRQMLVDAAVRCLGRDGIAGFTIDRICAEAGVSRGLIGHYFGGKDGLLIEVYRGALYGGLAHRNAPVAAGQTPEDALVALVDAAFAPDVYDRATVRVWLALWDEIAVNPALQRVHRDLYDAYRGLIARVIADVARTRRIDVEQNALAQAFLALTDGLWLEWSLDPEAVERERAHAQAIGLLEAYLGPIHGT